MATRKRRREDSESDSDVDPNGPKIDSDLAEEEEDFLSFSKPSGAVSGGPPEAELPPWADGSYDPTTPPLVALHNEILRFCDLISPSEEERASRARVVADVTEALMRLWPGCSVKVFGSELTGLCLPSSDLDVACLGPVGLIEPGPWPLRRFAEELRVSGLVSQLEVVESAKVPIVKLVHARTSISCDVSFNVEDGLVTGHWMRRHLELHPPLRPLLLLLKYFLMQRGLNETYPTGGVGSFLLQLMALSLVQQRKRRIKWQLAALAPSNRRAPNSAAAGTADAHPDKPSPSALLASEHNLGSLLLEFLELYGRKFNIDAVGVSCREGGSYFPKHRRMWTGGPPRNPGLLCVENPMLPDVDVGRNAFNISTVRRALMHGHMVLVEALANQTKAHDAELHTGSAVAEAQEETAAAAGGGGGGSSVQRHSFKHPVSSSEVAASSAPAPTSALASVIFADGILLERELPPGANFTSLLPPPPQQDAPVETEEGSGGEDGEALRKEEKAKRKREKRQRKKEERKQQKKDDKERAEPLGREAPEATFEVTLGSEEKAAKRRRSEEAKFYD